MDVNLSEIASVDPEIAEVIRKEAQRQADHLELIASENIASRAVMATQGSILTNKYAEGYPQHRYYGGCECVDVAEMLATQRAQALFDAEYVNVQPHSGSQANMAVYFALLKPGDTVLGMNLAHGGHLTHGAQVSFSGQLYRFLHYGVSRQTGTIDYDQLESLARQHRPRLIVAGASAYPRVIDFEAFGRIAGNCGALLMVDMAHIAGLVAAGIHPSPVPHAHVVTSTTHKTLKGPRGGLILAKQQYAKALRSQVFPGIQGGPLMHVIAAKAVAFKEALSDTFKAYQRQVVVNAKALAEWLLAAGIELVSGGTDNHMLLVDLRNLNITGRDAEAALGAAGITVNKNAVPFETRPPSVTSGIRMGTPFVTSRGMTASEMESIADFIVKILGNPGDTSLIGRIRGEVRALCDAFPLYSDQSV